MPTEGETRISSTGVEEFYNPFGEWVAVPTPEEVAKFPVSPEIKEPITISPDEAQEEIAEFEKETEVKDETGEPIEYKYDIDVYKDGKAIRVSNVNVEDYLAQGWSTTKPAGFDEELPEDVIDEEDETPEETEARQVASDIAAADKAISDAQAKAMAIQSTISDASSYEETGAVIAIRDDYEVRRIAVREMGERQKKALETFNIRRGTQRYAVETAEGIITETERLILRELSALKTEENRLVNAMKQSIRTENYDAYMDLKDELGEAREKKVDRLQALNDTIREKNDEIEEKNRIARRDIEIFNASKELESMDPGEIFDFLNGKYTLEEIEDAMDILEVEPEKVTTQITDIEGRKVLINKNTGEVIKDLGESDDKITTQIIDVGDRKILVNRDTGEEISSWKKTTDDKLSPLDIERLQEKHPDAGIAFGDTDKTAEDKIVYSKLEKKGFTRDQAKDLRYAMVAPPWFIDVAEAELGTELEGLDIDTLWYNYQITSLADSETPATEETEGDTLETLKEGVD